MHPAPFATPPLRRSARPSTLALAPTLALALAFTLAGCTPDEDDETGDTPDATIDDTPDASIDGTPDGSTNNGMLWQPPPETTWQWQIIADLDTSLAVEMYDIDLFDATDADFATLRQDGRIVICYFSAGSHEDWRADADAFPADAIGSDLDGWPGERWFDFRDATVRTLLAARLDFARDRGCDGVEPDNVDGYTHPSGFDLTPEDQLDFNRFLAREAHARGLSIGLKNDLGQIPALVDDFDWALNEQCAEFDECALLQPFIEAGKAVFHVEYVDDIADGPAKIATVCSAPGTEGFSTLVKKLNLDAWVMTCPE